MLQVFDLVPIGALVLQRLIHAAHHPILLEAVERDELLRLAVDIAKARLASTKKKTMLRVMSGANTDFLLDA